MTDYAVKISKQAKLDMTNIYNYIAYELHMPEAAMRQFNRIADAINTLHNMPMRIKIMDYEYSKSHELRQLMVDNYSVLFTVSEATVFIVRVLYSSMDLSSRLKN